MQTIEGLAFFPLTFDDRGKLESRQALDALIERATSEDATDAVFLAHGFRNDVADATGLYTNFLKTFRHNLTRPEFKAIAGRQFVVGGVYWPSKPFRETFDGDEASTRGLQSPLEAMAAAAVQFDDLERDASAAQRAKLEKARKLLPTLEGNSKAQDEFVSAVLSILDHSGLDETEGLPQIKRRPGSELLVRLSTSSDQRDRGIGLGLGTIAGGVGQFLNLTTWYVMKDRSGTVGAHGAADAVRALHAARPSTKIHLVGHSLGGRLMAACAKALADPPIVHPDSLTLLEAAFSHYGFSPNNGHGQPGFFRDVIARRVVKGPLVSTFSAQDTVVGKAYSIMSRLAGDNTREIGDGSDEFGGIGRNGPLKTKEVETSPLRVPGKPYDYKAGFINNLDGSGGLIKNHGDVTSEAVTYAFASAIACT